MSPSTCSSNEQNGISPPEENDSVDPLSLFNSEKAVQELPIVQGTDNHLIEFSEALITVTKALRQVAQGKASAQIEAAEWKRKYELERARNRQLEHEVPHPVLSNEAGVQSDRCCGENEICSHEVLLDGHSSNAGNSKLSEKFFSDLNLKIEDLFTGNKLSQNSTVTQPEDDKDLFLSKSKLWICFREPVVGSCGDNPAPVENINAPYLVGLFPIHLAVLTSSTELVYYLINERGAKLDVKCVESDSPFYGMTPLDMILHVMSKLIPWTQGVSFADFTSKFLDNKPMLLLNNLQIIVLKSFGVQDLIFKLTLQAKITELATLLTAASFHNTSLSSMHVPTVSMPPELNNGAPMMLRMFVAATITSLISKEIHLSGKLNESVELINCKSDLIKMNTVMKLLVLADRGELARALIFPWKEKPILEDAYDSLKGGQSLFNRHVNPDMFYKLPSLIQPCGSFNTLAPPGCFHNISYDGLKSGNAVALTEIVFRELNGRKFEELSFGEACQFRSSLGCKLQAKLAEENTLMKFSQELSSPSRPLSTFSTSRKFSTVSALTIGAPCCSSTGTSVPEQLVARKLLSVLHAMKKVRM
ncbi:hypothetical protein POM88_018975 [Heracleum sosnowskyi]|uniref:Uncharacterized protein n=1 Tax=Heracleum sosnowskyi TaxID=360622 RepID=A0AAD8MZV2_9APIA|nr:hypothetical protein POM88_018975 [Heracleum sosnowskyi]